MARQRCLALKHINLRHLAEVIGRIAPTLDGAGCGIEEMGDAKAEAEHEAFQAAAEAGAFDCYEPADYEG